MSFPLPAVLDISREYEDSMNVQKALDGLCPIETFLGSFVRNIQFNEATVSVIVKADKAAPSGLSQLEMGSKVKPTAKTDVPDSEEYWLCSNWEIPFVARYEYSPYYRYHLFVPLPFINARKVKTILGWINGQSVEIEKFEYFRAHHLRDTFCYYLDATNAEVKSGRNSVVLYVRFAGNEQP